MSYPVKYAPMPVMVVKEWDSILGQNKTELDIYYIASRCYVLGETKRYFMSLPSSESYKVRFPYSISQTVSPTITLTEGTECVVEKVYDESELEQLKEHLKDMNRKLLSKRIYLTNYDSDKIRELTNSYNNLATSFSLLEEELENLLKNEMPFEENMCLVRK